MVSAKGLSRGHGGGTRGRKVTFVPLSLQIPLAEVTRYRACAHFGIKARESFERNLFTRSTGVYRRGYIESRGSIEAAIKP